MCHGCMKIWKMTLSVSFSCSYVKPACLNKLQVPFKTKQTKTVFKKDLCPFNWLNCVKAVALTLYSKLIWLWLLLFSCKAPLNPTDRGGFLKHLSCVIRHKLNKKKRTKATINHSGSISKGITVRLTNVSESKITLKTILYKNATPPSLRCWATARGEAGLLTSTLSQ